MVKITFSSPIQFIRTNKMINPNKYGIIQFKYKYILFKYQV